MTTKRFAMLSEDDMDINDTDTAPPSQINQSNGKSDHTKPARTRRENVNEIVIEFANPPKCHDSGSEALSKEVVSPPRTLQAVQRERNATPVSHSLTTEDSNITIPPPADNKYLVQLNIELSSKVDNMSHMIEEVKQFLDGFQRVDSDAQILPCVASQTFHHPLVTTKDDKFPNSFVELSAYVKCRNLWVLEQETVDTNTL